VTGCLADTHALLWWLSDDPRLSERARTVMAAGALAVLFSAASIWEAEIRAAAGKLALPDELLTALKADRFVELPITARHAREAARLAPLHRDPFDRMIVAQARLEGLVVISADSKFADYGVEVLW
jgi:PIN domain nuclease of toxin-antitoxin system